VGEGSSAALPPSLRLGLMFGAEGAAAQRHARALLAAHPRRAGRISLPCMPPFLWLLRCPPAASRPHAHTHNTPAARARVPGTPPSSLPPPWLHSAVQPFPPLPILVPHQRLALLPAAAAHSALAGALHGDGEFARGDYDGAGAGAGPLPPPAASRQTAGVSLRRSPPLRQTTCGVRACVRVCACVCVHMCMCVCVHVCILVLKCQTRGCPYLPGRPEAKGPKAAHTSTRHAQPH